MTNKRTTLYLTQEIMEQAETIRKALGERSISSTLRRLVSEKIEALKTRRATKSKSSAARGAA